MANDTLISRAINKYEKGSYFKTFKVDHSDGILREHNYAVYNKIIKGFARGNKVLYEQATGTGKSYLALKFLYDHAKGKRVLFVSPTNAIKDGFSNSFSQVLPKNHCQLDTCLYQGLKSKFNEHYDIIIFDEVHHMGAEVWGADSETVMENNPNALILGMTATIDRSDKVDVCKYFDGHKPVSRITLVEALEKKFLPKPDYTLAKVDFNDEIEYIDSCIKDFKEKLKRAEGEEKEQILEFLKKLKRAKQEISESDDISKIFAQEITTDELKSGKFVVFCPTSASEDENNESIQRMKKIMKQAPKWFEGVEGVEGVKVYCIHSKQSSKKNAEIIKSFEEDKSGLIKLLFSINMLNEGLHIDDIDGVIMLRATSSKTIYLQQLGRALSVGHKQKPKIFDFVANLHYVDIVEIKKMVGKLNNPGVDGGANGERVDEEDIDLQFRLKVENLSVIQLIDTLHSEIFGYNTRHHFEFNDFCNRLDMYNAKFGNYLVPFAYCCDDKYPLGVRVNGVRTGAIVLDDSQKAILNQMGFVWVARGLDEDNIRVGLKKFVERFNKFVQANKRFPNPYTKTDATEDEYREEVNLYRAWMSWRNRSYLKNEYEAEYLKANGIEVIDEVQDNIRREIKNLVAEYNEFVTTKGREPSYSPHNETEQENEDEKRLYDKKRYWTSRTQLLDEEEAYLKNNLIQLEKATIRPELIQFVNDYNAFVTENGRVPQSSKNNKKETNLYSKYIYWRDERHTNKDEQDYFKKNLIQLQKDTVRKELKQFVEEFNAFVATKKRKPTKAHINETEQENKAEANFYTRWKKWINARRSKLNSDEIKYLQDNGFQVVEADYNQANEDKPSGGNFEK